MLWLGTYLSIIFFLAIVPITLSVWTEKKGELWICPWIGMNVALGYWFSLCGHMTWGFRIGLGIAVASVAVLAVLLFLKRTKLKSFLPIVFSPGMCFFLVALTIVFIYSIDCRSIDNDELHCWTLFAKLVWQYDRLPLEFASTGLTKYMSYMPGNAFLQALFFFVGDNYREGLGIFGCSILGISCLSLTFYYMSHKDYWLNLLMGAALMLFPVIFTHFYYSTYVDANLGLLWGSVLMSAYIFHREPLWFFGNTFFILSTLTLLKHSGAGLAFLGIGFALIYLLHSAWSIRSWRSVLFSCGISLVLVFEILLTRGVWTQIVKSREIVDTLGPSLMTKDKIMDLILCGKSFSPQIWQQAKDDFFFNSSISLWGLQLSQFSLLLLICSFLICTAYWWKKRKADLIFAACFCLLIGILYFYILWWMDCIMFHSHIVSTRYFSPLFIAFLLLSFLIITNIGQAKSRCRWLIVVVFGGLLLSVFVNSGTPGQTLIYYSSRTRLRDVLSFDHYRAVKSRQFSDVTQLLMEQCPDLINAKIGVCFTKTEKNFPTVLKTIVGGPFRGIVYCDYQTKDKKIIPFEKNRFRDFYRQAYQEKRFTHLLLISPTPAFINENAQNFEGGSGEIFSGWVYQLLEDGTFSRVKLPQIIFDFEAYSLLSKRKVNGAYGDVDRTCHHAKTGHYSLRIQLTPSGSVALFADGKIPDMCLRELKAVSFFLKGGNAGVTLTILGKNNAVLFSMPCAEKDWKEVVLDQKLLQNNSGKDLTFQFTLDKNASERASLYLDDLTFIFADDNIAAKTK